MDETVAYCSLQLWRIRTAGVGWSAVRAISSLYSAESISCALAVEKLSVAGHRTAIDFGRIQAVPKRCLDRTDDWLADCILDSLYGSYAPQICATNEDRGNIVSVDFSAHIVDFFERNLCKLPVTCYS